MSRIYTHNPDDGAAFSINLNKEFDNAYELINKNKNDDFNNLRITVDEKNSKLIFTAKYSDGKIRKAEIALT